MKKDKKREEIRREGKGMTTVAQKKYVDYNLQ